jgi:hypothetical protein
VLYLLLIMAHMWKKGKGFEWLARKPSVGRSSRHISNCRRTGSAPSRVKKATTQFNGRGKTQPKYEHDTFGIFFCSLLRLLVNLMVSNCNITPVAMAEKMGRVMLAKMACRARSFTNGFYWALGPIWRLLNSASGSRMQHDALLFHFSKGCRVSPLTRANICDDSWPPGSSVINFFLLKKIKRKGKFQGIAGRN